MRGSAGNSSSRENSIEVVRLEVQQHRDLAGELVHVLQLERRQLTDDPLRRLHRRQRTADIAGDDDGSPRSAENRAQQLHGRRLAVRSRDSDEAAAGLEAVAELDLAPHRDLPCAGLRHERVLAGHARALHEEADAAEQGRVVIVSELGVGDDDVDAPIGERRRRGPAGPREADDERA
jgi:hypothetical protein